MGDKDINGDEEFSFVFRPIDKGDEEGIFLMAVKNNNNIII